MNGSWKRVVSGTRTFFATARVTKCVTFTYTTWLEQEGGNWHTQCNLAWKKRGPIYVSSVLEVEWNHDAQEIWASEEHVKRRPASMKQALEGLPDCTVEKEEQQEELGVTNERLTSRMDKERTYGPEPDCCMIESVTADKAGVRRAAG